MAPKRDISLTSSVKIECTGRVSRVDQKFLYINCTHGSVFCPLSKCVEGVCHDLRDKYEVGDVVHLQATRQEAKNDCEFLAVKVRPSKNTEAYQRNMDDYTDQEVMITKVTETLAYGRSEIFGAVFIPGSAFPATQTGRLAEHICPGDKVVVDIRAQSERNGCSWLATKAISAKALAKEEEKAAERGDLVYELEDGRIQGTGSVIDVEQYSAIVWCQTIGRVNCSILTWCGGDGGIDAEHLTEIIGLGFNVSFIAKKLPGKEMEFRATRWMFAGQDLNDDRDKDMADTYTQTVPTVTDYCLLDNSEPILELLEEKPVLQQMVGNYVEELKIRMPWHPKAEQQDDETG
ncbi:unnamed protein product, partial [Mesorhabditis spiculigera]